jgi:hypothetical protein
MVRGYTLEAQDIAVEFPNDRETTCRLLAMYSRGAFRAEN